MAKIQPKEAPKETKVEDFKPLDWPNPNNYGHRHPRITANLIKMIRQKNRPVITFSGKGVDLGQNELTGSTYKSHKAMLSCDMALVYLMGTVMTWAVFHLCYAFFGRPDTIIFRKKPFELGKENGYKGVRPYHWVLYDKRPTGNEHQDRVMEDYKRGQYE